MQRNSKRMHQVLDENDRRGELKIALMQSFTGLYIVALNISLLFAGESPNSLAVIVGLTILLACAFRVKLSNSEPLNNPLLHILTVIDGILIYLLMISDPITLFLPMESAFKSPSVIFLALYVVARIVRFDPVPIIVSGATVVVGWLLLLYYTVGFGTHLAENLREHMTSENTFVIAELQMSIGFCVVIVSLTLAAAAARKLLGASAHMDDLEDANKEILYNSNQLESLLNNSIDAILICDENGVILRHNPALGKMLGFGDDELVGQLTDNLMDENRAKALQSEIREVFQLNPSGITGKTFVSHLRKRSGTDIPVELAISQFPADGKPALAAFIRDISHRLESEDKEKQAMQRFEMVVSSAIDAIIIIDDNSRLTMMNPAAEELFGLKFDEVKGQDISELIIPTRMRAAHRQGMKAFLNSGDSTILNQAIEVPAMRADGSEFTIELAVKKFYSGDSKSFIGYARDVSASKVAEEQLVAAKEEAESANQTKSRFLAMMSHEIRTPLNGVLGLLSALESRLEDEECRSIVSSASESGHSLMTILNDLLDLSKLEAGKFSIEPHDFELKGLIDGVVALVKQSADEKGVEIRAEIDPALPSIQVGDADRIRQILLNLVWNAIKFTPKGSVVINVDPGKNGTVLYSVSDTGIGFAAEKVDTLFQEFGVMDSSYARKHGGTGLGLAISKALVVSMEGQIWATSNPGKGAKFFFELPLVEGNLSNISKNNSNNPIALFPSNHSVKVLVAEDNRTNQMVVAHFLEKLGCDFAFANNGYEAVKAVKNEYFDLILMDVSMPDLDGCQAARQIRAMSDKQKASIPIVALTAYALKEDRDNALACGMDAFLAKPIDQNELAATLVSFTGQRKNPQSKILVSGQELLLEGPSSDELGEENQVTTSSNAEILGFDMDILKPMLSSMTLKEREEILRQVERDFSKYKNGLEQARDNEDTKQLESVSHGLKGIAGMFGAGELAQEAAALNEASRIILKNDNSVIDSQLKEDISQLIEKSVQYINCISSINEEVIGRKGKKA